MMPHWLVILALAAGVSLNSCTGPRPSPPPDIADVTLPVPVEEVKRALTDVLTTEGYDVGEENSETLETGTRKEIRGPWNWLLRWRFGVGKSRVEAKIIPLENDLTRVRLQVFHRAKDGIFDRWEEAETPLPQSATNQIRLLKNALQVL